MKNAEGQKSVALFRKLSKTAKKQEFKYYAT